MPFGGRIVEGKLTLAKVGMKSGEKIEGEFDLKVAETHGGFMDRGRGGRGEPGGFGPPPGGPGRGPGGPGGFGPRSQERDESR